jgi:hypothetical protein
MIVDVPRAIAADMERFTGRSWLLPRLLDWLEHSRQRLLIVTGEPGCGKSSLTAWLAGSGPAPADSTDAERLTRFRCRVRAAPFCRAASGRNSPRAVAEGWANQLLHTVPGFGEALAATLADRVQIINAGHVGVVHTGGSVTGISISRLDLGALGDELSFDRAFREPLRRLYDGGYAEPVLLLLDALDEALTYTGSVNIVQLLARLEDLPSPVRILVTSRPEPRVLYLHGAAPRIDLIDDAPLEADDVALYAGERLAGLEEPARTALAERIAAAAGRNFLYAQLTLKNLLATPGSLSLAEVGPLPPGLGGLYAEFLNRQMSTSRSRWFQGIKPVLGLLAVAQGDGLTRAQLAAITGQDVEEALEVYRQYLEGEPAEGPFRLFHHSFREFLTRDPANTAYRIDAAAMHRRIASFYWDGCGSEWGRCDAYGLAHLAGHLFEGRDFARLWALLDSNWVRTRLERGRGTFLPLLDVGELAWRAAEESDAALIREGCPAAHLAEQLRDALCFASVGDLAGRVPPELFVAWIEEGMWSPEEVLDQARRTPGCHARLKVFQTLAPQLPKPFRSEAVTEALAAANQVADAAERLQELGRLLSIVPPDLRPEALRSALAALGRLTDERDELEQGHYQKYWQTVHTGERTAALGRFTEALGRVSPGVPASLLDEKLRAGCEADDETSRARVAAELASYLVAPYEPGPTDQGLRPPRRSPLVAGATDMKVGDHASRAFAMAHLVKSLNEPLAPGPSEEALRAAVQAEPEEERARALTALAPWLAEGQLVESLTALRTLAANLVPSPLAALPHAFPRPFWPRLSPLRVTCAPPKRGRTGRTSWLLWPRACPPSSSRRPRRSGPNYPTAARSRPTRWPFAWRPWRPACAGRCYGRPSTQYSRSPRRRIVPSS